MTVYEYIVSNNPQLAKDIIESFGYRVVDPRRMAENLQQLVASEGEEALKMVMANHPDKEIIVELFTEKKTPCKACEERTLIEKYANANGSEKSESKAVENNFSILFLAGVTILAVAILKK